MKKFLTAALCCLLLGTMCFGFTACGDTDGSELHGFDIDLAREFAKSNDLDVEFRLIQWGQKEMELESGRCDLIWNGLTVTDERKEAMELSRDYLINYQVLVIRTEDKDKFTDKENLLSEKAKLCAEEDSAGAEQMETFTGCEQKIVKSQRDALLEVKARHQDAAIIDSTMANYMTKAEGSQFNDLTVIENLYLVKEHYAVAAYKGNVGLIAKVNEFFKTSYTDGSLKKTAEKYEIGDLVEESYDVPKTYDSLTAEEKASWEAVVAKGKMIVGYTINPPIAIA